MKKKEVLFICIILLIAGVWWGVQQMQKPESYKSVTIIVKGEVFGTYSLEEDQGIEINDTNIAEIKDGQISMISANCPDHLCIYQGAFGERGGMIVCLPNEVIIRGEDMTAEPGDDGIDAVVR
ncbi:MAG: NusG domain II-containing protein [Clostridiales bacterium]|nr:NusG domain II-containing protein [Candidatus Blautia equi]